MKKAVYLLLVLFVFNVLAKAQNTMLLVNGKKIEINEYKIGKKENKFLLYKNRKGKTKTINKQDIFSIKKQNGKETIFYVPDTSDTSAFSIEQMRNYVEGAYDARTNYKTPWINTAGILIGGGSAALSSAGMSVLLVPILPIGYSSVIGNIKLKKEKIKLPDNFKNNEYYTTGYLSSIKRKRTNHAILSSLIGVAAGISGVILLTK